MHRISDETSLRLSVKNFARTTNKLLSSFSHKHKSQNKNPAKSSTISASVSFNKENFGVNGTNLTENDIARVELNGLDRWQEVEKHEKEDLSGMTAELREVRIASTSHRSTLEDIVNFMEDPSSTCNGQISYKKTLPMNGGINSTITTSPVQHPVTDTKNKLNLQEKLAALEQMRHSESNCMIEKSKAAIKMRQNYKEESRAPLLALERQLLLSTEKFIAVTELLENATNMDEPQRSATMYLSNISIDVKNVEYVRDNTWFLMVAMSKDEILATQNFQAEGTSTKKISSSDKFRFNNLTKDFKLYLKVFYVTLHLKPRNKLPFLPGPTIAHPVKEFTFRNTSTGEEERIRHFISLYRMCGLFEITLDAIRKRTFKNLHPDSFLESKASMDVSLFF